MARGPNVGTLQGWTNAAERERFAVVDLSLPYYYNARKILNGSCDVVLEFATWIQGIEGEGYGHPHDEGDCHPDGHLSGEPFSTYLFNSCLTSARTR